MPFTPLHLGPGIARKAGLGERFSLLAFGLAQVTMDLEPLSGLLSGAPILHGLTHTYPAALFIGLAVALITPPLGRPILRRWNRELTHYRLGLLVRPAILAPGPVVLGALSGTLSHVALDGLMHAAMQPVAPWSSADDWLGMVSMSTLFWIGALSGVLGALIRLMRGCLERPGDRHV